MRLGLILLAVVPLCGQGLDASERQRALGAQLDRELRRRVSVVDVPEAIDYLDRLAERLVAQFPGDRLRLTFMVMSDDTTGGSHEPIALPGGYFFVPAKLFLEARDGTVFAGMIAHAIAHLAVNHGPVQWMYPELAGDAYPIGLAQRQQSIEREAHALAAQVMARTTQLPEFPAAKEAVRRKVDSGFANRTVPIFH